jgi:hypothetical protein
MEEFKIKIVGSSWQQLAAVALCMETFLCVNNEHVVLDIIVVVVVVVVVSVSDVKTTHSGFCHSDD